MDGILVDLGFVQIYWYSVMLFVGFLLGGYLLLREAKRFKIDEEFVVNLFFYTIPISIIGARLYYVTFNWEMYADNIIDIFKVWEGGLAIHGGILFGLLFVIIYTHKHGYSIIRMMDMASVGLIVGQIIGRWGNFFNQEAHGPATTLETLKSYHLPNFIIEGMNINGTYYHPTFLYESLWNLVGLIIMLIIRRTKKIKLGQVTGFYMIWYGVGRYFIESLRTDSLMYGDFKVAQLISIAFVIIGLVLVLKNAFNSKFEVRYNEGE